MEAQKTNDRQMDEKTLIESVCYEAKAILKFFLIAAAIITIVGICFDFYDEYSYYYYCVEHGYNSFWMDEYSSGMEYFMDMGGLFDYQAWIGIAIAAAMAAIGGALYLVLIRTKLVVTDKRVYGSTLFGKQVDLPLDSISSLAMGLGGSIAVSTSSGRITFWGISNRDNIHKTISELLKNRQAGYKKENAPVTHVTQQAQSSADELKKYKDLLDSGIISQEEFDAKKKQLLGL